MEYPAVVVRRLVLRVLREGVVMSVATPIFSLASSLADDTPGAFSPGERLVVGCDGCPARRSKACDDCFVAVMLKPKAEPHGRG